MAKKNQEITIRSSAAEYLSFVASSGEGGVEAIYADESIWLTQKMMSILYDVKIPTINYHLGKIFSDSELQEDAVVRNFRITAADGKSYDAKHYNLAAIIAMTDREVLQDAGRVTAELAKAFAESEFEKYRIVQDRLFESDFDREVKKMIAKNGNGNE
ncbi:virulence-like protein [Desulfosarcina sp. OttesenSCG-928-A07]|nr:virulence-like protein [Desulfosarcina sp. OttesenSCG-928-G17]MDL2328877.1 virulence-like protein [Desulfosarcina sp. OttesenSCG-928-A07]